MKKLIFLFGIAALCACESLKPEKVDVIQLGIVPDDIVVSEAAGEDGVRLIADRAYSVAIVEGADWLTLGVAEADTLSFSYEANAGLRRSGRIRISADGRSDELVIKQEGIYVERVQLSEHSLTAPAAGRSVELRVLSNLPSDYFSVSASSDEAIGKLLLEDYILSFDVNPTTNRDKRTYEITVACTNGWGERVADSVMIVQDAF